MKTIELIDRYEIRQEDGEYNPPSYIWVDNTGELIRCKDCRFGKEADGIIECFAIVPTEYHGYDWFCPIGERKDN